MWRAAWAAWVFLLWFLAVCFADVEYSPRLTVRFQFGVLLFGQLHDVGVETTAKTTLGRHDDQHMNVILARAAQQQGRSIRSTDRCRKLAQNGVEPFGIGPCVFGSFLCPPQFCGGHHLHGLGDPAGRFDRLDPQF